MIPEIGIMIGAYIVTRCADMMTTPGRSRTILLSILGILTMLVTVVTILDLASRGTSGPGLP